MRWLAWLVRLTIAPVFLGALLMLAHSPTSVHNVAASLGLTVLGAVHVFYWWHPWPNRPQRTVVATAGMVATNFFLLNLLGLAQPLLWLYPALIVGAGGDELVPRPLAARPDVAVVDIEMPGQDGISAASELRQSLPSCRTLRLTMYGRPGYVQRAMEGGISSFVLKDAPVEVLASAIRRCAAGEDVVDPSLAARALRAGPGPLSAREREILEACADGLPTAEIAARLWLSEGTVRNRVSDILGKLGVRNRAEAVQIARENGWL